MPIAGTTETVERITDEVAADFHRRFYVGERTVITVAGNLPLEELSGAISEAWSVLPPLREPLPERMPPSERPPQDAELRRPFQQAYVALARLVLQPTPKERMALALLNFLLGEGWSSRLYQRIRERHGLVYSILSELEWYADCGLWSIVASTNPTALPRVERLVRDELNRLAAEGIRPDEFRRGCTFLQARMAMALDNPAECMALLARAALEGTPTTPHHALQLMAELSPEDVNAAALRWCPSEQWSTVRLLPTE
jgi:predicted Zn-dependent peptidase